MSLFKLGMTLFFGTLGLALIPILIGILITSAREKTERRRERRFETAIECSRKLKEIVDDAAKSARQSDALLKERIDSLVQRISELEKGMAEKSHAIEELSALAVTEPFQTRDIEIDYAPDGEGTWGIPYTRLECLGHMGYNVVLAAPGSRISFPGMESPVEFPIGCAGIAYRIKSQDGMGFQYGIVLSKNAEDSPYVVVHETWHLFMLLLEHMGNKAIPPSVLNDEIYAYAFGALYKDVQNAFHELVSKEN